MGEATEEAVDTLKVYIDRVILTNSDVRIYPILPAPDSWVPRTEYSGTRNERCDSTGKCH